MSPAAATPTTTRETIEHYFASLERRADWESSLADDMRYTSFTAPVKQATGRDAFLQATKGFYSSIRKVQLRELLVDGDRAVALTHYELQRRDGAGTFTTDVAEVFAVRGGKIASLDIYFDSAPFAK